MDAAGKRWVITGGGSGIGLAVARLAAERGASEVVLLGRNGDRLGKAASLVGPVASIKCLDVADSAAVENAFSSIGSFDHLVTSAAGITIGPFVELDEAAFRDFFEVKFWGQYRAVRAGLPHIARDGSITLFSGYLYRKPEPGFSAFAAVNGAIEALVKTLAREIAPVRINALAPGQIDTLGDYIGAEANEARRAACAATLPVQRIGTPEEAAHAVLFLAENGFTTGTTLDVDGGQ